jgi:colanic acid/amylovoran biosynthesis glycosyltransferase
MAGRDAADEMPLVSRAAPTRVAHVIETCFKRTETFIYEQVLAPGPFEAWCLAGRIQNATEFPFERVRLCEVQWNGHGPWDLVDRALWKVRPRHELPFWRSLREVRPAFLHAHLGHTGHRVIGIARRYGLPLATSFYGRDASSLPREKGWMPRLRQLFASGDVFLAEGPKMRARLIDLGCPAEKIRIVPLLIDPDRYSWRPRQLHPEETLRLIFVGRFVAKKGLPVLLRSLARARPSIQALELVVIGSGSDAVESDLKSLVRELQLADVVRFTGSQPRSAVLAEMARAHVLIAPSHTGPDGDTEGGPPPSCSRRKRPACPCSPLDMRTFLSYRLPPIVSSSPRRTTSRTWRPSSRPSCRPPRAGLRWGEREEPMSNASTVFRARGLDPDIFQPSRKKAPTRIGRSRTSGAWRPRRGAVFC